jgi:acid phosphatase type 7
MPQNLETRHLKNLNNKKGGTEHMKIFLNSLYSLVYALFILTLLLFALNGCTQFAQTQGTQNPKTQTPVSIAAFTVTPVTAQPNQDVSFAWSLAGGTPPVTCTLDILDIEGDGKASYSIPDCQATLNQTHQYSVAGRYEAILTVVDSATTTTATVNTVVTSPSETVTLLAAGDIACDPKSEHFNGGLGTEQRCRQKYVADLIGQVNPNAVLTLGDTQYEENTLEQFKGSYDLSWGKYKAITYPVVGNHEYLTPKAAGYFSYFGAAAGDPSKGYYSYDLGAWHIVALNSNCGQVGGCAADSPQGQWLKADLAAHPTTCTLAYWHHPRFSSGHHGSDAEYSDFWTMLQQAGAELVLVGHDHDYERFAPQDASGKADPKGLRQFVVGTGGKGVRPFEALQPNSEVRNSDVYGVLKVTLQPSSYTWEFVTEQNSSVSFTDAGSDNCR